MVGVIPGLNPTKTLIPQNSISPLSLHPTRSIHQFNPNPKINSKSNSISQPNYASAMSTPPPLDRRPQSPSLVEASSRKDEVLQPIRAALGNCLSETKLHLTVPGLSSKIRGKLYIVIPGELAAVRNFSSKRGVTTYKRGKKLVFVPEKFISGCKVRDIYDAGDYLVLVTTDRQSAFDRILASVPFKGQVLNETSLWWFGKIHHIAPSAVVAAPDKNVTIAKKCSIFPVEFVVRGYVTGSTDTSLWTVYKNGVRNYCGNSLPDGLVKNQKLSANILTPTTKAADHDVPITPDEIIERGLMTKAEYDEVSSKALSLFNYGQQVALEHGLILVDTKYEFGKATDGSILIVDEVHTPDSSRYWIAQSYEERFQNVLEPENVDKEFLRLWFKDHCNPYEDEVLPDAPEELVTELAWRYIFLYETITGSKFDFPNPKVPIHDRISSNVSMALSSLR